MLDDIWVAVQVELAETNSSSPNYGKNHPVSLKVHYEGNTIIVPKRTLRSWIDDRGRPQSIYAFWVKVKRPNTNLGPVPSGGAQVYMYFEGIPEDTSYYTSRIVGPYAFHPRDESGVVIKTIHKTPGKGDLQTFVSLYNAAVSEYTSTGKAVIGEVVDHNKNWGIGRRGVVSDIIPWLTQLRLGNDIDSGLKCDGQLGDFLDFPGVGVSGPGLNKLWYHGFKHDVAATGSISPRGASTSHIVISDHETFYTSPPASATINGTFYEKYGTGVGVTALVRGRQAGGKPIVKSGINKPYFVMFCGNLHDIPGDALMDLSVCVNNNITGNSGSAIGSSFGGIYGGIIKQFGGFYSGLLTRPGDSNPGLRLTFDGSHAWWGVRRTMNTGQSGVFELYYGTDRADAESAGARNSWTTGSYIPISDLVSRINATADCPIVATDMTTDAYRLDCTFISHPSLAAASPLSMPGDITKPFECTTLTMDFNVIVDIHANGIANTINNTFGNTVNTSIRGTKFLNYCGAAAHSGSSSGSAKYIDYYVTDCCWHDDKGYYDRTDTWQDVGAQVSYWTGEKDGAGVTYSTFANGAGMFFLTSPPLYSVNTVVGNSFGVFGLDQPGAGFGMNNCVSPSNVIPAWALNSSPMLESYGPNYPTSLTFVDAPGGDFRPISDKLLRADGSYAGAIDIDGKHQAV